MERRTIEMSDLIKTDAHGHLQNKLLSILDSALNPQANPQTSPDTIANQLDQLCPHYSTPASNAGGLLWVMWTFIFGAVKRIPYDDERMQLTVSVVGTLKRKCCQVVNIWGTPHMIWGDLPVLGYVAREEWDLPPEFDGTPQDKMAIRQWISLNSFAARLVGAGVLHWESFALWELRSALEQPHASAAAKETRLITASEWLTHAGRALRAQGKFAVRENRERYMYARALRAGELFVDGGVGFSEARWHFWRARMEQLCAEASTVEMRERLQTAIDAMLRVDSLLPQD